MRLKPLTALRSPRLRGIIALSAAIGAFAGVGLATASPSLADPTQSLVVVGSDTIQDIYNQFALDAAGNLIGSYNATNPVTNTAHETITPVDGTAGVNCSFARPNGSTEGVSDLRLSINPASTNGSPAPAPVAGQGCVDIARASSGPTALINGQNLQSNTGPIVYVPFALDGVGTATGPANAASCPTYNPCPSFSVVTPSNGTVTVTPVSTKITTADSFTFNDLQTLYDNCQPVTEGGVTYDPTGTISGDTPIDLYIPQPGSGTRSFFASTIGFSATTPPTCVHDHIVGGALATDNVAVEEHDGTVLASDPNALAPFSIAQWIAQRNGHNNRRHGALLHTLAPCSGTTCSAEVSPFNPAGNAQSGSLNTNFPITRDVYSVVSFARVTNTSDPLFGLLNGTNSFLCTEQSALLNYGFGLLGTACGEVIASNRVLG
jgi:ABC-type phosphate transport system substrate-binding protein